MLLAEVSRDLFEAIKLETCFLGWVELCEPIYYLIKGRLLPCPSSLLHSR